MGNTSAPSAALPVTIDTANPTVAVNVVDTSLSDGDNSSQVTFTFSEAVGDFAEGDIVVTGGQLKLRPGVPVQVVGQPPAAPAGGATEGGQQGTEGSTEGGGTEGGGTEGGGAEGGSTGGATGGSGG
jgi:hypothetical protein